MRSATEGKSTEKPTVEYVRGSVFRFLSGKVSLHCAVRYAGQEYVVTVDKAPGGYLDWYKCPDIPAVRDWALKAIRGD